MEPNGPEGVLLDPVGVDDECPLPDHKDGEPHETTA